MILIETIAGLANRMRALDAALAMGREVGAEVRLRWPVDPDLGCPFEELFEPIPGLAGVENFRPPKIANEYDPTRNLLRKSRAAVALVKAARGLGKAIRNSGSRRRYLGVHDVEGLLDHPEKILELFKHYDVEIRTFYRFWRGKKDFEGFEPAAPIRRAIEGYADRCRGAIGVHVRRSDNSIAIANSPLEAFIGRMRAIVETDGSARFFVATDSPEVLGTLIDAFGERIAHHPKESLERGDPRAIKDALTDLYCLASCDRILGSFWSSFTDVASEIRGIPREIVRGPGPDAGSA
jgi:hypothetical protein